MAKNKRITGAKACICDKCGAEAHSIPGSQHRRCGGAQGNQIKQKGHHIVPSVNRGKWV